LSEQIQSHSLKAKPRKIGAKGLDRESVLGIAIRIVNEVGVNDLSLKRLADEAGVAPPSIYAHFASLGEVKRELTIRAYETLTRAATAEVLGKAGADAVTALSYAYRAFVMEYPGLHSALAVEIDVHDQRFMDAAHAWVDLLYRVVSLYQLGPDEKLHVTRALRSLLYGFATMEQQGNFTVVNVDRDESFRLLVEGFLVSLQLYADKPT
jgi:AcrR family transcriptional regulator